MTAPVEFYKKNVPIVFRFCLSRISFSISTLQIVLIEPPLLADTRDSKTDLEQTCNWVRVWVRDYRKVLRKTFIQVVPITIVPLNPMITRHAFRMF